MTTLVTPNNITPLPLPPPISYDDESKETKNSINKLSDVTIFKKPTS